MAVCPDSKGAVYGQTVGAEATCQGPGCGTMSQSTNKDRRRVG